MRFDGWEKRLNEYLATVGPFEWGTNDCCQFTLGRWCELCTGINHFAFYQYKTELGALKILKKHGGVEGLASLHLGGHKPIAMAQRGDILSFTHDEGVALGICLGDKIAAVGPDGLLFFPIHLANKAWSVL